MKTKTAVAAPPPAPNTFTLRVETEQGAHDVAVNFDFSTLDADDIARANRLASGGDGFVVTLAFLFVKVANDIDLEDTAWPGFRDGLLPAFEGDESVVEWIGEDD